MESIFRLLGYLTGVMTVAMTGLMLLAFRGEHRVSLPSTLLSALIALALLPVFVLVSGVSLNPVVSLPLLGLGMLVGLARGQAHRLAYRGREVMGRHSRLCLLVWGISLGMSQLANVFGSAGVSAAALIPVFLTTGMTAGFYGDIFVRRLLMRSASPLSPRE